MHAHGAPTGRRLALAAVATGLFVVAEFAIGWWANSLALISDAGHNLTDMVALVLSGWAFAVAARPADLARTFGYHRVGVLAALANAVTLVLLAGYIFYEGYQRFVRPQPVESLPMIVVALVAFALNAGIVAALHRAAREDVNVRSALVHMLGDAISSVGVLVAGVGVWLTGSSLWDPVISLLIGAFILWSSVSILRETVNILLEGTPAGLDLEALARDIEAVPGVRNVHDLHAWSLASNVRALSAHLVVEDPASATQGEVMAIVRDVKQMLAERYHIAHATLETHCSDCVEVDGLYCTIPTNGAAQPSAHEREHAHAHPHGRAYEHSHPH
ncbi:MAG: cation transporter [Thermomicrobiaceae bacterium]|nr:cation transporter [Thermomicrobiaceae bacterium]